MTTLQFILGVLNVVQTVVLAWLAVAYKSNGGSLKVRRNDHDEGEARMSAENPPKG